MSALLFDGVQAYISFCGAKSGLTRSRYQEAFNWVNGTENDYVFSFENVCDAVGIDPEYLRLGLANVCRSQGGMLKKMRKGF